MTKKSDVKQLEKHLELMIAYPETVMLDLGLTKEDYNKQIDELKEQIKLSKRGKSNKIKGANYERDIAKIFQGKLGISLKRTPMSGGFSKGDNADAFRGDITTTGDNQDFKLHVECKNHLKWSLPQWIKQAESDCPKGKIPIVIYHRRELNKDGKRIQETGDFVTISLSDFLNIVDKDKIYKEYIK